ncbi:hypothetical protein FQZ97_810760 [compost metagenome]
MQDLAHAVLAVRIVQQGHLDGGQDGVVDRGEGLRDQRRTDGARGVATAQREQVAAPARGHGWRGQQVARQIDDVLQVVVVAQALQGELAHGLRFVGAQAGRPADAAVQASERRQRHRAHTGVDVGLDHIEHPVPTIGDRPHVERRVRPGGLGQVLDRRAHARVALHQDHVARAHTGGQQHHVGGKTDARRVPRCAEVARQRTAYPLPHALCLPV